MPFVGIDERKVTLGKAARMLTERCHMILQEKADPRSVLPYLHLVERVLNRDGADEYDHRDVPLEGRLVLEHVPAHLPMECTNQSNCRSPFKPFLVGTAQTDTGASNIANVERMLELLAGREVRVTIEWKGGMPNAESVGEDGQAPARAGEGLPGAGREVFEAGRADGGDAECRG